MRACKIFFLNHLSSYLNSLADALSQMGHQIYYQTSWNLKEIEAGIAHFRPDLMITAGIDKPMFHPELDVLPELCRRFKLRHIYWATEDGIHFETISLPFARRVRPDIVWTIHPDCVAKYHEIGIEAEYVNFAFNPRLFPQKKQSCEEIYEVSFVGSTHLETRTYRYDSLKQLLFPLLETEVGLHVWGNNWPENQAFCLKEFGAALPEHVIRGHLPYKHTANIYCHSQIVLGVQNAVDQVTQRTFEILGTGAFMIGSRTEALETLFRDGEELVLSSSPEETVELVHYYASHPEERRRIGRNARQKVLEQHTFEQRLAKVWPKFYSSYIGKGAKIHD